MSDLTPPNDEVHDVAYWRREAEIHRREQQRIQAMIDAIRASGATCSDEPTKEEVHSGRTTDNTD